MKRFTRRVLLPLGIYGFYLAALGPFSALEGNGSLDAIPPALREACWYPSVPIWMVRGVRRSYANYLDWWYRDPNTPDPPLDW
jgi:hypothetical protein